MLNVWAVTAIGKNFYTALCGTLCLLSMGNGNYFVGGPPDDKYRARERCQGFAQVYMLLSTSKGHFRGCYQSFIGTWLCTLLIDLIDECLLHQVRVAKEAGQFGTYRFWSWLRVYEVEHHRINF